MQLAHSPRALWGRSRALLVGVLIVASAAANPAALAFANSPHAGGRHVLLLSVDGLHASDLDQ